MQNCFEVFVGLRGPFKILNAHPQGFTRNLGNAKSNGLSDSPMGGESNHAFVAHRRNFDGLSILHFRHKGNHTREREIHRRDGITLVVQNVFYGKWNLL
jgi:hypothetical protein